MHLFKMWSYLCGRVAQRNIDVTQQKKRWTDDLQTNGLDGRRALAGSQVEEGMTSSYTGDVGVKEKHNGEDKQEITKGSNPKCHLTCKMKQKTINNSSGNTQRIKLKEKFTVGRSARSKCRGRWCYEAERREQTVQDSIEWKILKINILFIHPPTIK